jgi:hypothetical protein
MARKASKSIIDPATRAFNAADRQLHAHPLFAPLISRARIYRGQSALCPDDAWAIVTDAGGIYVHPIRADSQDISLVGISCLPQVLKEFGPKLRGSRSIIETSKEPGDRDGGGLHGSSFETAENGP